MTPVIAAADALIGDYLREHPDITVLGANVAPRTPRTLEHPWIRVTQIDARDIGSVRLDHLISYLIQLDCYASDPAMTAYVGQGEASTLARTARAALLDLKGNTLPGLVVTDVQFNSMPRIPDPDFKPARERYVLDVEITAHG